MAGISELDQTNKRQGVVPTHWRKERSQVSRPQVGQRDHTANYPLLDKIDVWDEKISLSDNLSPEEDDLEIERTKRNTVQNKL